MVVSPVKILSLTYNESDPAIAIMQCTIGLTPINLMDTLLMIVSCFVGRFLTTYMHRPQSRFIPAVSLVYFGHI